MVIMAMALPTISVGILLLKATTSSSPLITDRVVSTKTPKVVVLIPPPVEAGEPPININIIIKNTVLS